MAGAIHSTTTKHQKLTTEKNQQLDPNNDKFHYHNFLYKAALVAIFFVILPLFPSQAPEFINQSLVTRNWELLHILFVGIAISYGLFSRRHDELADKDNNALKFDNAQSIVSRFLQVSSFFEDEAETETETSPSSELLSDETPTKVQTWSNQHHRNEPVVVVAPQQNHSGASGRSRIVEKPLLLPVRSLKSRLCDDHKEDNAFVVKEPVSNRTVSSKRGSKSFSQRNSIKARNAELEGPGSARLVGKVKDNNVVLPSPIPWRSRSGKLLETKQEVLIETPAQQYGSSKPNSVEESEFNKLESRSVRSHTSRSSPKVLTPSPPSSSISSESLAKNAEDVVRKKAFYKSCPPPPPPPPPMFQKSISMKPIRYGSSFNEARSFDKELKRSCTTNEGNMSMRGKWGSFERGKELGEGAMNGSQLEDEGEEERFMEELPTRKTSNIIGKGYENILVSEPASMEFAEEEKQSFLDKVIVETDDDDDDSESEDEDAGGGNGRTTIQKECVESAPVVGEGSKAEIVAPSSTSSGSIIGDEGPDVDKKADEFIAKFREQIRLQRIESIKRSTRSTRNSSR